LFEGLYQNHREKIAIDATLVGILAIGTNLLLQWIEKRARAWAG